MTARYRCRFAPSPTGYLHVGSAHSALCNWLFARANDAAFLLRIEDTDAERNRPELTDNILDMLRWLGLEWDGDPVHQSDRFDEYATAAGPSARRRRSRTGATAPPEQVQARNKAAREKARREARLRRLLSRPCARARARAAPCASTCPDDGVTGWDDLIRGKVAFDNDDIEDFVVVRSNGNPTFFLANVVDDDAMEITHVHPGRGPRQRHAEVPVAPRRARLRRTAGVRAPSPARQCATQEAVEATRRRVDGDVQGARVPARGDAQLSVVARMGPARRGRGAADR